MSEPLPRAGDVSAEMVQTRVGAMQCAVAGEGSPVLVLHGSPGGFDQAQAMARFLPREQFKAIMPSRPGYLETKLGDRLTIDQQADQLAALLDRLDVNRAGVLCWSGGGPVGYRLAVRHPRRVSGLVAFASVSKAMTCPPEDGSDKLLFNTRAGDWMMQALIAHAPKRLIAGMLEREGKLTEEDLAARTDEVFGDPVKRDFVLEIARTVSHRGRQVGLDNDCAQFAAIDTLELANITARCLIVQGDADTDVDPEASRYAAAEIPGAELLMLEGGTHFALYTHPDATTAQGHAMDYLHPEPAS